MGREKKSSLNLTVIFRTGKRSVKGSVMDGVNSAKRYINKSFKDDEKQVLFTSIFLKIYTSHTIYIILKNK